MFGSALAMAVLGVPELSPAQDPEPLRREETLEGRDFQYNRESFLHRFTYRLRPADAWRWILVPSGYRGTLGSTRGDEFYSDQAFYQQFPLTERASFDFRFRQAEDFDGTYERTLIGATWRLSEGWSASLRGDLQASKEDIDAHLELAWHGVEGRRLRLALVLVDPTFNTKSDEKERYRTFPYTAFTELLWRFPGDVQVQLWANLSPHAQLALPRRGYDFLYDQYAGGARAQLPIAPRWWLEFEARGETGERDRRPLAAPDPESLRSLVRRQWEGNLELHHRASEALTPWIGYRRFFFDERDRRPLDLLEDADRVHREHLVHLGVSWRVNERLTFWPGLYVALVDARERLAGVADHDDDWAGKLALPVDLTLPRRDARLTLNPTLRVDQFRFGGANLQFHMSF